jgi:hypothetical protein
MTTLATIHQKRNELDAATRDDVESLDDESLALLIHTYMFEPERVMGDEERIKKACAMAGAVLYREWLRRREVAHMELETT